MVLAERLEDFFERGRRRRRAEARAKGLAEGKAEGKAEVDRVWGAWLARLEEAKEQGRPFAEPPPVIPGVERESGPPMKIRYDRETDTLRIVLRDDPVADSYEPVAGLILDLDGEQEVIAIELLDASRKTSLELGIDMA